MLLRKIKNGRDRETERIYRQVLMTDPCVYCGEPPTGLDHIHPKSRGGRDGWENRAPACAKCDDAKGTASVLVFLIASMLAHGKAARRQYASQTQKNVAFRMMRAEIYGSFYRGNIRFSGASADEFSRSA